MKKALIAFLFAFVILFSATFTAFASTGVSINTGKIVLDKPVVPGGTYVLPSVQVTNSGTEASDYAVTVQYNDVQSTLKPDVKWFHFDPATFHLNPGEAKLVKVSINVPASAVAGDYFAYVEAHAIQGDNGKSSISGAAATKLYLSVGQSNFLQTGFYSISSIIQNNTPVSYVILWIVALIIVVLIWKRIKMMKKHLNSK